MTELQTLSDEQRHSFGWLSAPHLQRVTTALEAARPDCARYVGGCVRDSLLGAAPKDFDIATLLTPHEVIDAVKKAGLKAAPTGIDHGTITVIVDHQGVEVTTLRADVSTDGRRATVAFTQDWPTDAGRRDFTINAIYLTPDGKLFDPTGGLADIEGKRVRFIGDPEARIREDYLRILRFFRFSARFAPVMDEDGLRAVTVLKDGIETLSAERIGAEFMAILALPRAVFGLAIMADSGVLPIIWDAPANIDAIARMKEICPAVSSPVILAALYGEAGEGVGARLRLSNAEKSLRANALRGAAQIKPGLTDQDLRALIYRLGRATFADAIAVAFAHEKINGVEYQRLAGLMEGWPPPPAPFSGKDIVALGVKPGPDVSRILAAAEAQWIAEDFPGGARAAEILSQYVDTG